jgi:hypothetical protein
MSPLGSESSASARPAIYWRGLGARLSLSARIAGSRTGAAEKDGVGGQHARRMHGDSDLGQKPGGLEKRIASQKSPATIARTMQKETHCTGPTRRTPHQSRFLCSALVSSGSSSATQSTLQSMPCWASRVAYLRALDHGPPVLTDFQWTTRVLRWDSCSASSLSMASLAVRAIKSSVLFGSLIGESLTWGRIVLYYHYGGEMNRSPR